MSKDDESLDIVFSYMEKQNRPFSAGEIHNNLQTQFGLSKTLVQKALDTLTAEGSIKEKVYGKSKIYFVDQSKVQIMKDEEIKGMQTEIDKYSLQYNEACKEVKKLESKMSVLKKQMSMKEIEEESKSVEKEVTDLTERLKTLKETVKGIDPQDNQRTKQERTKLVVEWKKRKRIVNDALDMILEGYPASKKKLMEEIGIETDEDCDTKIPTDL